MHCLAVFEIRCTYQIFSLSRLHIEADHKLATRTVPSTHPALVIQYVASHVCCVAMVNVLTPVIAD